MFKAERHQISGSNTAAVVAVAAAAAPATPAALPGRTFWPHMTRATLLLLAGWVQHNWNSDDVLEQ